MRALSLAGTTTGDRTTRRQIARAVCAFVARAARRGVAGDEHAGWQATIGSAAYDTLSVSLRDYSIGMPRCGGWLIYATTGSHDPQIEYHLTIWAYDRDENLRIAEAWGGAAGAALRRAVLRHEEGERLILTGSLNAWAARKYRSIAGY